MDDSSLVHGALPESTRSHARSGTWIRTLQRVYGVPLSRCSASNAVGSSFPWSDIVAIPPTESRFELSRVIPSPERPTVAVLSIQCWRRDDRAVIDLFSSSWNRRIHVKRSPPTDACVIGDVPPRVRWKNPEAAVHPVTPHEPWARKGQSRRSLRQLTGRTARCAVARTPNSGGSGDTRAPTEPCQMNQRNRTIRGQQQRRRTDKEWVLAVRAIDGIADVSVERDLPRNRFPGARSGRDREHPAGGYHRQKHRHPATETRPNSGLPQAAPTHRAPAPAIVIEDNAR